MIKRILSVLITCMLFCASVSLAEVKNPADGEILLNDTFEYQLDGATPSGYTVVKNGNNCTLKSENKNRAIICAYNEKQTKTSMYFDKNFGTGIGGSMVMECKVKTSSASSDIMLFSSKSEEGAWVAQVVQFTEGGKIKFRGTEICSYQPDTLYHIILFFDMTENKVSAKINSDFYEAKSFSLSNIKNVRFEIDFTENYEVFVDDIRIYGGREEITSFPEPAYNKDFAKVDAEPYNTIFERPASTEIISKLSGERPRVLTDKEHIDKLKTLYESDEVAKKHIDYMISSANANLTSKPVGYNDTDARTVAQRIKNRVGLIGMAYLYTKDEQYAERLWKEAESFCAFPDWFPGDHLTHTEFLYSSAFIYDWLYDWFEKEGNESKREILYNALMEKGLSRCEQVYDSAAYGSKSTWATLSDNVAAVCNGGVICATMALLEKEGNDETVLKCLEFSLKSSEGFLSKFAPDGGWYEGFGYASYAIRYFVQALSTLENSCNTDFGLSKAPGFSDACDFYIYMTAPGGIFNFHDNAWYQWRNASEMYYFANKFQKPYLGFYAIKFGQESKSATSFLDLAFYEGGYKEKEILPDRYFKSIETAAFSSKESYLGVHAGKVGVSHGEFDAGNFVFDAYGVRFIEDLGPDSYSLTGYNTVRDDFIYYRRRAEGHNTLVINPSLLAGQYTNGDTKIEKYRTNDKRGVAVLDLTSAYETYGAESVKRGFVFDREAQSVILRDEISLSESGEIYSFFHTKADVKIADDGREATLTRDGKAVKALLLLPLDAKLEVMDAVPLSSSPVAEGQSENEGVKKLFVHLFNTDEAEITLQFLPLDDNAEQEIPPLSHFAVFTDKVNAVFSEDEKEISADICFMAENDETDITVIFAGYDEDKNLADIDVFWKKVTKGLNYTESAINRDTIYDYAVFVSEKNKFDFKKISKEVE